MSTENHKGHIQSFWAFFGDLREKIFFSEISSSVYHAYFNQFGAFFGLEHVSEMIFCPVKGNPSCTFNSVKIAHI
jgi:hypothetical protein